MGTKGRHGMADGEGAERKASKRKEEVNLEARREGARALYQKPGDKTVGMNHP